MKFLLLITGIICILIVNPWCSTQGQQITSAAEKREDGLLWSSSRNLSVADFQYADSLAKSSGHNSGAFCSVTFIMDPKMVDDKVVFTGTAIFYKKKSWISRNADHTVLKHEQGHFDIAEIYARKFTAEMKQFIGYYEPDLMLKVMKAYDKLVLELDKEQAEYDKYSLSSHGQNFYYEKIAKLLAVQQ
ncbi:hypothetical protein HHL16_13205 [Pseudoflavitalea sp. G-6-1-2]|uniref:DUF922 domain-containing protein n=1 Tax=Pseudoflavitalea sp. G-6-1-2 TaxID=2728841 RepID=UPI00146EA612|nr:hypothetical protein [Pseudoflavitalea sp. G-6-1-2]NML21842.1 hypothetical protein [Pseudoflavitalea sp. G-6-1-2]